MVDIKLLLMFGVVLAATEAEGYPKWPDSYKVSGVLRLPYAEINEPFTGWYQGSKKRSRIEYYNKTVVTILKSGVSKKPVDYGKNYKIAPVFLKGKQEKGCFLVTGTKDSPVKPQGLLPDLTNFTSKGKGNMHGKKCDIWQLKYVHPNSSKVNTYTMWVSSDASNPNISRPVRYEMMGYDTLIGSHYDKYYLDYNAYASKKSMSDSLFEPDKGLKCGDFPGPGDSEHHVSMNPMTEYIDNDDSHTDDMFEHFKKTHKKSYQNDVEHTKRKDIFKQNLRFITSKNRAGLSYALKMNHLTDRTDGEMKMMRGYKPSLRSDPDAIPFNVTEYDLKGMPESLDWRLFGAVTPVKDQAWCGSCWSFGTAETIEGAVFLKTRTLTRLSQQELMDCTWDEGNNGCDGGEDFRSYKWILKNGLATEESYGPYLAADGYCHYKNATKRVQIKGYVNVSAGSHDKYKALKVAIAYHGPVSVAIDASHKTLSFYSYGVYYDQECGSKPENLDHAVLAVGYGVQNGEGYWLIKNSWSTHWGNDGYVLMSQKWNNCGVETMPTYVKV